jgi:hypothetical protein
MSSASLRIEQRPSSSPTRKTAVFSAFIGDADFKSPSESFVAKG